MFRILNIIAVLVLVGSAVYAYEIKYKTLYQAEQLAKTKRELARETDRVAMLKAEWSHLASPERIGALTDKYLGGQTLQLHQIVQPAAVPEKQARGDEIGAKLDGLGGAADVSAAKPAPAVNKPAAAAKSAPKPKPATHAMTEH